MSKSVLEQLSDAKIRFRFEGYNDGKCYANVLDAPMDELPECSYAEAMNYFKEALTYHKSASGDGGEGF